MVFVIISAEIDLSVGSMMGLLGGVAAICDVWLGWPLPLTIIVTLVLDCFSVPGTDGGSRTVKSLHLLSPSRACWHFAAYSLASPTARLYPHQRRDVTNWAKLSPASTGFIIGALGLMAFVGWQWRGRMRRQAFGFTVSGLYRSSRSPL